MRAIQNYLPNPRHTEVHRIFVNAAPEIAWETARHFDMSDVPWIKVLFNIRTLPEYLSGHNSSETNDGLGVDEITKGDTGFMILHETPGKEVVVGSIGQFWHLKIPFKKVTTEEYRNFREPGFGIIAWSISVEPYRDGSTIAVELRTSATDESSWKKLERYYTVIGIGSKLIRMSVMAHLETELGKMKLPDVDHMPLAGDELIPHTKYELTSSRNIEAPRSIVWRYLMQLGCDRAGWYSIDLFDNGGRTSTEDLIDDWGPRAHGDKLSATPKGDGFFNVYASEPERHFIIGGETERAGGPFKMTWAFVLEPIGDDATRLITRARMESSPKWKEWIMGNITYPPVHGLMSHVQLDTIKRLAEHQAQIRTPDLQLAER